MMKMKITTEATKQRKFKFVLAEKRTRWPTVTHIALVAVVGRLVFDSTLIGNLFAFSHQLVTQDLDVLHGLHQAVSDRKAETHVCNQYQYSLAVFLWITTLKSLQYFLLSLKQIFSLCCCGFTYQVPKLWCVSNKNQLYSLDHLVGVWVSGLQSAGHIPGHMNHGDNGLHLLHFVPLKPLERQLILVACKYT